MLELAGVRLTGGGHLAIAEVLNSPDVDAIMSPYQYETIVRQPAGPLLPHGVFDSPWLHKKLYIVEDDTRTSLCFNRTSGGNESQPDEWCRGSSTIRLPDWTSTIEVLKRNILTSAIHRAGIYWYDFNEDGWFGRQSKPEQSTELWAMWTTLWSRLRHVFRGDDRSVSSGPEVALLVDDISAAHLTLSGGPGSRSPHGQSPTSFSYLMHAQPLHSLAGLGVPFRTFLLSDLLLDSFPVDSFKLIVLANALKIPDDIQTAIKTKLQGGERTLFYMYGPGMLDQDGEINLAGPAAITGLPLQGPCTETNSTGEKCFSLPSAVSLETSTVWQGQTFGPKYEVSPWVGGVTSILCAQDQSISCHGHLVDHPEVTSLVTKRFANYSVGFSASLGLPVWLWMEIAEQAGVHLQWSSGYDDTIELAGNLLVIIGGTRAAIDSNRTIRLGSMATAVYDDSQLSSSFVASSSAGSARAPGRLVCTNCSSFVVESVWQAGEVHVFWVVGAPRFKSDDDHDDERRWPAPASALAALASTHSAHATEGNSVRVLSDLSARHRGKRPPMRRTEPFERLQRSEASPSCAKALKGCWPVQKSESRCKMCEGKQQAMLHTAGCTQSDINLYCELPRCPEPLAASVNATGLLPIDWFRETLNVSCDQAVRLAMNMSKQHCGGVLFFASQCTFESTVTVQAGLGFRGGDTGSDEFSTAPQITITGPADGPAFLLAHVDNVHFSNLAILAQTTGVIITDSALVRLTNVAINAQTQGTGIDNVNLTADGCDGCNVVYGSNNTALVIENAL